MVHWASHAGVPSGSSDNDDDSYRYCSEGDYAFMIILYILALCIRQLTRLLVHTAAKPLSFNNTSMIRYWCNTV